MTQNDQEQKPLQASASRSAPGIQNAQQLAEEALRKHSEWLRVTLSSIGDAVISTDITGLVTSMNGVAESLTGWNEAAALGRPLESVFQIVNEDSRQPVENPALKALKAGTIVGLANHTILIAKDGTQRPIDDSASPIRNDDGQVAGVVLVFRDITQRKLEEVAQAERARLVALRADVSTALVSALPIASALQHCCEAFVRHLDMAFARVWTLNESGDVLELKASAGQYTHLDGPHSRVRVGEFKIGRIASSGKPHLTNSTYDDPNISDPQWAAREGFVSFAGYPLTVDGRVLGVVAMFARHTLSANIMDELVPLPAQIALYLDRKQDEQRLRESEARLADELKDMTRLHALIGRLLVCQDPQAALEEVLDATIAIIGTNMGCVQLYNPRNQTLDIAAHRGLKADAIDRFRTVRIDSETAGGRAVRRRQRVMIEDVLTDELYEPYLEIAELAGYRSLQSTLLSGHNGEPLGVLTTFYSRPHQPSQRDQRILDLYARQAADFVERSGIEAALRHVAAELSEADRRKNEFLAMLAHELRNPLAPVRNALQLLKLSPGDSAIVQSASQVMERQVEQMVRLVDDLLDLSRISRGKIELRRQHVDLQSIVQQAVETSRPAIEAARHKLTLTMPAQPVYLNADPVRLAQVISNLLNNSCKYSEPEGRISLSAALEETAVAVSIKDTGVGIPPEMLPRVFDIFTQVDRSLERSQGGLGIGLTLVQRLVEMHGGSVTAASAGLGRGSEFVIRLPTVAEAANPTAPPAVEEPPGRAQRRILIVDDNEDSACTLAMLLKFTGNETSVAHDGQAAVEAASAFRPDVMLLDIGLPKLNGYEVARRIRVQPWGAAMTLVALTGWGQDEDRRKSKAAGFDGHMVKPVEYAALMKLLAELDAAKS
jgi:PAS domain S-box-containing protein